MRLSCPSCQTEYEVPDAALAGRARTLRCANCGHQWQLPPPAPAPAALPPEPPLPPPLPPRSIFSDPVAELPAPVMASSRAPAPVSFVPEPVAGPSAVTKRKFPIPETPLDVSRERPEPAAAPLTYANRGYQFENERPRKPGQRRGPSPILVSILIVLIAAMMVWIERVHVMHIWPPSIRLFNWINALFAHKQP